MPRKTINYQNTIIYKLICNDLNITEIYVGCTTNFTGRKRQHKECVNNMLSKEYNQTKYQFIRDNGGWENWSMIEIEKYPCNDSNESKARERYFIETLNSKINTQIPNRTKDEYYDTYKEHIKEYQKLYKTVNKEQISNSGKVYREINKDKIKEYKLLDFTCECGSTCKINDKARHIKSKKHQNFIN